MAKAPAKAAAPPPEAETAPPPKKKKRGLVIAIVLLVVLGGAGAGAWFFLGAEHEAGAEKTEAPKEPEKPPVFHALESFTVNLQPEAGDQYLQVGLALKVKDSATVELIKARMPEIRNGVLLQLSSKRASEISTIAGKEKLSEEILAVVRKSLAPATVQEQVQAVLFTSFVIQ
ncbi:MAG: flagellar basal body-associated protein FliL [Burkholderiales bacterium]